MSEGPVIEQLAVRVGRVEGSIERIARSLEKLVVLETQIIEHRAAIERAFGAMKEVREDLADLREVLLELKQKQPLIDVLLKGIGMIALAGVVGLAGWVWTKVTE